MTSANTIATILSLSFLAGAGYYLYQKVNGGSGTSRGGYTGKYDPKTGLGRGAPGFQTNVARVAVPAHIIARIRAGEEVSAEEITAAQEEEARRQEREAKGLKVKPRVERTRSGGGVGAGENEWLPEGTGSPGVGGARGKGRKR